MWAQIKRVLKPRGVFVTTASQPFTSALVMSDFEFFRYSMVWDKGRSTGFLDAKFKPLNNIEDVLVFGDGRGTYNPQMIKGDKHKRGSRTKAGGAIYNNFDNRKLTESEEFYPDRIIRIRAEVDIAHPTQSP